MNELTGRWKERMKGAIWERMRDRRKGKKERRDEKKKLKGKENNIK